MAHSTSDGSGLNDPTERTSLVDAFADDSVLKFDKSSRMQIGEEKRATYLRS